MYIIWCVLKLNELNILIKMERYVVFMVGVMEKDGREFFLNLWEVI